MPADVAHRARSLDAADRLAGFRYAFCAPEGLYLDGNSLGPPSRDAAERVRAAVRRWERGGVSSWPHWLAENRTIADRLATVALNVDASGVALADSTSVNLYKLVEAVVADAEPGRRVIVVDPQDFPTNRYVVDGIAARHGLTVRPLASDLDEGIDGDRLGEVLGDDVAAVTLSHVNYRSGALADMAAIREAARRTGTRVVWDLSHSAGVVPLALDPEEDLAVGCTYKHLGGGPGAPGFVVVPPVLHARLRQPIWGWFGHRDQFGMHDRYEPDDSIDRFLVGTPPVLSTAPLAASLDLLDAAGLDHIREKSRTLLDVARAMMGALLEGHGFRLASPLDPARAGAHLTMEHEAAWQICQAARDRGIVLDYREPRRVRIGPAPLFTRHHEVAEACVRLADIVRSGAYRSYSTERHGVT